jgi:esterase/lipase superfamily enzyme
VCLAPICRSRWLNVRYGAKRKKEGAAVNAAELSDDVRFSGATGLFTWPSAATTFDYGYDRESAMWSRDGLEALLLALAQSPSGGRKGPANNFTLLTS